MATLEKLTKALEALKVIQPTSSSDEPQKKRDSISKKEKILHCSTVAESICSHSLRNTPDFLKVLGFAVETFLACCNDEDSDVRLMADECLNRTIKTLLDSHLNRLQLELYKEIKKDGPARSLRAALSRFADLCHRIRPEKFRPYAVNLLPCLAKICQRSNEESVQDTLAIAIGKVMPVLGLFTNDKEIKMLLKALLPNLSSSSAMVRRAAAASLTIVCQYSRRPSTFFSWLLAALFDFIIPVQAINSVSTVLGVLLCLRHIVPHLGERLSPTGKVSYSQKQNEDDVLVSKNQLLKIYEITLYFTCHPDHNVITSTLETLYQLLKTAPEQLVHVVVSPSGITHSQIYAIEINKLSRAKSESQSSMLPSQSTLYDDSALEDDPELYAEKSDEESQSNYEEFAKSSFDHSEDMSASIECESDDMSEYSGIKISKLADDGTFVVSAAMNATSTPKRVPPVLRKGASDDKLLETDDELWGDQSLSPSPNAKLEFKVGNVGCFTDSDVPLKYCTRLLCSSFLLAGTPGTCIPDRLIRVSVKSLALGCLSCIFTLYPKAIFLETLIESDENQGPLQRIWDILMYMNHSDPHLKGQCAVVIGHLIQNGLRESGGCWDNWIEVHGSKEFPSFETLFTKLLTVVQDSASVASKLGLVGLKQCINAVLESMHGFYSLSALDVLIPLKNNSYWLTKVELIDLVSEIPFKVVYHLDKMRKSSSNLPFQKSNFQNDVLNDMFVTLLSDEDFRVRQAAASGIVKIVSKLFFATDHRFQDPIIAIAKEEMNKYLDLTQYTMSNSTLPLVHALVMPFNIQDASYSEVTEKALTRVISSLVTTLRTCTNKYLLFGCCHALCALSEAYPVSAYHQSWKVIFREGQSLTKPHRNPLKQQSSTSSTTEVYEFPYIHCSDIFNHLIALLTHTTFALDIMAHQHALQLTGNLMCGACYLVLQERQKLLDASTSDELKVNSTKDTMFKPFIEPVFTHVMKLLNIFAHILDEQPPVVTSSRPALPSLPNPPSLSPMKRKNKTKEESNNVLQNRSPAKIIQDKTDGDKDKVYSKCLGNVGLFHTSPLYAKLYGILNSVYASYKISMDFQSSEKFCQLLKCALDVLAQLLEVVDSQEMSRHAEEILNFLKSVMNMEPSASIQCVRQLLKALFGANLTSLFQETEMSFTKSKFHQGTPYENSTPPGLYHTCITEPYTKFTHVIANKSSKSNDGEEELISSLSWMKRGDKLTNLLKSGSKGDKANLAAHIKLFEAVVIKALKLYTITGSVNLQCQVLDLLSQLVHLRVNYCLLDSDQIFIGFIMKQIEYIEEGQIQQADVLIPRIFYFLILLSYERYHSKSIISVPRILQLCDGLIASGQPPECYVIKALHPVVEDLFLVRGINKVDLCKELDAQREVVVSTLFKLLQYPQVFEPFILIANQTIKEGEDKWRKLSRQIVDAVLPLLARQQLQVDSLVQLNTLHRVLEIVSASVFRPVDILLKALFTHPKDLKAYPNLHRWISMILVIFRILICQSREEVILSRMHDMDIFVTVHKLSCTELPSDMEFEKHPDAEISTHTSIYWASLTFARFVFQVVGITVESIYNNVHAIDLKYIDQNFLCQQMSHVLLYLMYIFQSGTFRRVTSAAMHTVKNDDKMQNSDSNFYLIREINEMFLKLSSLYPTLVVQWCNVLTLLNYDCESFWSRILWPNGSDPSIVRPNCIARHSESQELPVMFPCNTELVRLAGITLLCDYVCENPNDAELMTLLIVNHVNDLIELSMEATVQDFFSFVNRNPAASGLLVQAVNARCTNLSDPVFMKMALQCLEQVHGNQSANLLILLIEKFLTTHHLILARNCDRMACKRIDNLLADPSYEQLQLEDIQKLLSLLASLSIHEKYQQLFSKLKKLESIAFEKELAKSDHPLLYKSSSIPQVELKKEWFTDYIKDLCFLPHPPIKECALLLSHLNYEDILKIMCFNKFQLSLLETCLKFGADITISSEKCIPGKSNDPFLGIKNTSESPLYRAARTTLLSHVANIVSLVPEASTDFTHMHEFLASDLRWETFCYTVSSTSSYLKILKQFYEHHNIPDESLESIAHLSILSCKVILWALSTKKKCLISPQLLHLSLELLNGALKNPSLFAVIILPEHTSWILFAIRAMYELVIYFNPKLPFKLVTFPEQTSDDSSLNGLTAAQRACVEVTMVVECLESMPNAETCVPQFILTPLKSIIRGLSRHPLVNSFSRTPPILWQLGWKPEFSGEQKTIVPPPPGEYLQERDVLKQYIYRVNLLGWVSRQQFEETWMALLGVLSATPIDEIEGKDEDQERIRTSCLAVKSITSLLLQTLLLPEPGNPQNSNFLMQPRDKPLSFLNTKSGKKLLYIRSYIQKALQELIHHEKKDDQLFNLNAERVSGFSQYSLSQVSLEYLCAAAGFMEDTDEADESVSSNSSPLSSTLGGAACYHQREQSLASSGLDIHSCLHFLLDLYSQWLSPVICPCTPLTLLTEVVRSVVTLSDIFMERAQFEWLLDTLLEVQRVHPAEDEIIAQYLVFGICKAAAVLGMEPDMLERLKKLLELNLKSTYLPTRIATLHGFIFLLEQGNGEESFSLVPAVSEYILKHLEPSNTMLPSAQNEDHLLIIWAAAFYMMENYHDKVSDLSQKVFKFSLSISSSANDSDVPLSVYLTILHGLERLLICGVFSAKDIDLLLKFTAERITSNCPIRSLTALGALLSCMYIGKSNNLWLPNETIATTTRTSEQADSSIQQLDTDNLITALERVTTLFERLRKGLPFEAEVICQVLPPFLMEFFPVQDVLNKVIGEFLSSQQPHPHLIAGVIHEVFRHLHVHSCEDIIQDWVMLSLSNFTQRSPIAMAVWSLTCFFISASSNPWLQALFPYVQNRMGKIEDSDKMLFCISGVNFRNQLKDEKQRQSYFATIQSVTLPDTPYADLLSCL